MNAAKQLRKEAEELGWQLHRSNGKHKIFISASGYKMPLPSTPKGGRCVKNVLAKLRRYA